MRAGNARPYGVFSVDFAGRADPGPPWGAVLRAVVNASPYETHFLTLYHPKTTPPPVLAD